MKIFILSALLIFSLAPTFAQNQKTLPSVVVKDLQGKDVNAKDFLNEEGPVVISFWATWCKPCMNELSAIAENYETWQEETGMKLIAISIDDSRNVAKVGPLISSKGWEYEVYTDSNGDFKRAMNVNTIPHTFLLNGKGEILWQHNAYAPGDENKLYELVNKVAKGESIK